MLHLTDELKFAQGGRRICYVHSTDTHRCIKVLRPRGQPLRRRQKSAWYKRLRPLSSFDDNLRELAAFEKMKRYDDSIWEHFPRCYGMEQSNLGDGIVTDLIRDEDSDEISQTFREYLKAKGSSPELMNALDAFFNKLIEQQAVTRDILDHNLVVKVESAGLRIMLIDGFGSSDFLSSKVTALFSSRRKVLRKIQRFRVRYSI
jgi:hypothetical protein